MKKFFFILSLIFAVACSPAKDEAQQIVDRAMAAAGTDNVLNARIEFDFRGRHYVANRKDGIFSYERIFKDSLDTVHDYVTNSGFRREINGEQATVPDSMAVKYTSSVNSVIYFGLLPYGLNDPAVIKHFLGEEKVEGKPYLKVKVTFRQEGGGEDFEDEFFYWFHKEKYTMDYFAYSFEESDEISFRLRKAINPRTVGGIRVQDYINYKPVTNALIVDSAMSLYKQGALIELSRIESENVSVSAPSE